ncbi:ATP-binding cassette domain-containing protein [bacterium]|nr:ATP-binding cassette domain-containing protein [bacterium]
MIELRDVTLRRGTFELPPTSLAIPAGQCGVITGAAGAGKTSIVEAVCGLQAIETGELLLRGIDAAELAVGERAIGYLPQDMAQFPQMTVAENIGFGPKVGGWKKAEIAQRVEALAQELELGDLLNRKPDQLSGGQQKRVAMARAVASNPDIVCLDEPFVSLDEKSRDLIKQSLQRLLTEQFATVLVVTHQSHWLSEIKNCEFQI